MEFRVVVDQFMTDTAAEADVILPAKDLFEQSDIIGSYWSPYVQFKPKILDPPGEVLPETEIYYHLAKKLGLEIDASLLPEPGNSNIEVWLSKRIRGFSNITLADLKKGPILPPCLQEITYSDMKFYTPSGKIELFSEDAAALWKVSPLPEYVQITRDNKFPLAFITSNTGSRIHSQFGNLNIIRESVAQSSTAISPADAEKRGIKSGQRIRIFNNNGEIFSIAGVSNRVPLGIVALPNGIWRNEGGGGNFLIAGRETDMGYGAAFHDSMVEVEGVKDE
jgi:anaerobic selenocysteine-containing dehydrogenase